MLQGARQVLFEIGQYMHTGASIFGRIMADRLAENVERAQADVWYSGRTALRKHDEGAFAVQFWRACKKN
jgi:hypothetical protein